MIEEDMFYSLFYPLANHIRLINISHLCLDGCIKYTITTSKIFVEISYNIIDGFYRIKIETKIGEYEILFLTRSKRFRKQIKDFLKKRKLNPREFNNHIVAFCFLIRNLFEDYRYLTRMKDEYEENLKFDGVFV